MAHLTNALASAAQLARYHALAAAVDLPSLARGATTSRTAEAPLPPGLLDAVFYATQCLTQAAGLLLDLPQSTTAQASVLLARAWLQAPGFVLDTPDADSNDGLDGSVLPAFSASAAAVYLVAKMGLRPRTARDVAAVYAFLASPASPVPLSDNAYAAFHTRVLAWEARLLALVGFDTHVALPHPLAVTYLQALGFLGAPSARRSPAARRALAYLNAALLSPQLLYTTHQPHELAVAAIFLAARDTAAHLPSDRPWWEVFDVDRETLGFVAVALRSVAAWAAAQQAATPGLWGAGEEGVEEGEAGEMDTENGADGAPPHAPRVWTGALTRQQVAVAAEQMRQAADRE